MDERAIVIVGAGLAAARAAVNLRKAPYFYSDQYDLDMEYVDHPTRWDRLVFRGDLVSGTFCAFWLEGRVVVAGLDARVPGASSTIAKLVESKVEIDPAALADVDRPLDSFIPALS